MDQRHRQVFELIKKATRLHRANVDATMPSRPLYQGQIPIVFFIGNHPGCRLTDISEGLKITRAATTKSVNRLVNSGMVAKKADPEDQRICRVAITPKGRRCIASGRLPGKSARWRAIQAAAARSLKLWTMTSGP